jgi:HEAT repeat protein
VCQSAVLILNNLGWQPDEGAAGTVYCVIHKQWDRCVQIGASAVEPLIAAIEDQDQNTRRAAATALGQIGDRRAVKPLAAVLKDKSNSDDVRQAAIQALGQIGDAHAVKPLIAALKHGGNDDNVRRAAAEALGQIGDASAVKSLGIALKYKSLEVRKAAVQALGQIGAPAIEPLTAALNHAYGIQVRIDAATELDNLGWQPDEGVAGAAYWVIRKEWDRSVQIGAPAVEPLIAALASIGFRTCEAAAQALGQIGDARAVKPLIAALKEKNRTERERQAAAQALGQIGDARAVKPLVSVLKDKNNENDVRRAAAEALGQIGDARAVKPLIGMLQHSDRIIRRAAAITLVALHQSGRLDEKHQRLIVAERSRITASHVDAHKVTGHTDIDRSGQPSDCSHIDTTPTRHADYGIGVTFPA